MARSRIRTLLKISLITLASLVGLVLVAIAISLTFVLTPARVTPLALRLADQALAGRVEVAKVDITFFSSFPNFGLRLTDGLVTERPGTDSALRLCPPDSAGTPRPLARFREARIVFNPFGLLRDQVSVRRIELDKPEIYVYIDTAGRSNLALLDLVGAPDTTVVADSTATPYRPEIAVRGISIRHGNVTFDDRQTRIYTRMNDIDLRLRGRLAERRGGIDLRLGVGRLLLWQQDQVVFRRLGFDLRGRMGYDRDSSLVRLAAARLDLNGLRLGAQGYIIADSTSRTADVHLGFGLHSGSLADLLGLLPETLVDKDRKVTARGSASLEGRIDGTYGPGQFPAITGRLRVDEASARYGGMPWGIDRLTADIALFVDLMKQRESYADIARFHFEGGATVIDLTGRADRLLSAPRFRFKLGSKVDLGGLTQIFPLRQGVEISGRNATDLKGMFTLDDIRRRDYGKVWLDGESRFDSLRVAIDGRQIDPGDSSYLYIEMNEGRFDFGNRRPRRSQREAPTGRLSAAINFSGLGFRDKQGTEIFLRDIAMDVRSLVSLDTTRVTQTEGELVLGGIRMDVVDTMSVRLARSSLRVGIGPRADNPREAVIRTTLKTDSLHFGAVQTRTRASLRSATVDLTMLPSRVRGERWEIGGDLDFGGLRIFSALFPIRISMPSSQMKLVNGGVTMNNTRLRVGRSVMTASGHLDSLVSVMLGTTQTFRGDLSITAEQVDLDQILDALDASSANDSLVMAAAMRGSGRPDDLVGAAAREVPAGSEAPGVPALHRDSQARSAAAYPAAAGRAPGAPRSDTAIAGALAALDGPDDADTTFIAEAALVSTDSAAPLSVFMIPPQLDLGLRLHIDKARLGRLVIDHVKGRIDIRDGAARMDSLDLEALGARMTTSAFYRTEDPTRAHMALNLGISDIPIGGLGDLIPAIGELLPLLRSCSGSVDAELVAEGTMDGDLTFDLRTMSGVVSLTGTDLEVRDSPEFREIAKMLMFKDKSRARIDSLTLNAMIRRGTVDVLPFEANVDRYRVIIGGTQGFDMSMNYNISIIKSQIPFKAGVDISGTPDDISFKITKARLKKTDFGMQMTDVDSARRAMVRRLGL
ncbi:MAG: AsmA family protein [Rikenellaceae bacterium]|nr:AsmA family protein [Rikenellaceae bacterium]